MRPYRTAPDVTWREFALRLALVAMLLAAFDVVARAEVPVNPPVFDRSYRLPAEQPLGDLAAFVTHIRRVRASYPDDLIVVFLGASPTYGIGIRDADNTFPAAFERAAAASPLPGKRRVRAFNLASNGLLLGDQYVIAKAIGDAADLYVVQLTYQTFDPRRSAATMREPNLPATLHVGLTRKEARALGVERRTETGLDRSIADTLRGGWFTLAHKSALLDSLSLSSPSKRLYALVAGRAAASSADTSSDAAVEGADVTTPFDELDPALQMVAISRASENSRFSLTTRNSELKTLGRLTSYLRSQDRRAVFFLAPMDEEVLAAYEVLDETRYARNVRRLRAVIEAAGYRLVDYHTTPFLTSADFVDLTHTTDSGGRATGERLWRDIRSSLESTPTP